MERGQSADTIAAVEQRMFAAYGAMEPWQKLRLVSELSKASHELAAAGIRLGRPNASDEDVRLILAVRRLGPELVRRATGRELLPIDE